MACLGLSRWVANTSYTCFSSMGQHISGHEEDKPGQVWDKGPGDIEFKRVWLSSAVKEDMAESKCEIPVPDETVIGKIYLIHGKKN